MREREAVLNANGILDVRLLLRQEFGVIVVFVSSLFEIDG